MFTDSKAEMNLPKRAHVHMTMNDAVWKAGLVIICSFARQQKAKICFSPIDSRLTKHNPLFKAWKTKVLQTEILPYTLLLWIYCQSRE